jgi:hypothetical protein
MKKSSYKNKNNAYPVFPLDKLITKIRNPSLTPAWGITPSRCIFQRTS